MMDALIILILVSSILFSTRLLKKIKNHFFLLNKYKYNKTISSINYSKFIMFPYKYMNTIELMWISFPLYIFVKDTIPNLSNEDIKKIKKDNTLMLILLIMLLGFILTLILCDFSKNINPAI